MNSCFKNFSQKLCVAVLMATALAAMAQVKTPAADAPALALTGSFASGGAFDIAKSRGKVVMVFFWSTKCSVCLNHMPELRANLAGWKGKPFELVTVNVDNDRTDWKTYEQISTKIESVRPTAIWNNTSVSSRLPLTLVLNTKGQVISRHEGRIALEAWDDVAEVLP